MVEDGSDTPGATNEWHPLPGLIGDVVVGNTERAACGDYRVENDGGDVVVYRVTQRAKSTADLEDAEPPVRGGDEFVESLERIAVLPRPPEDWDAESSALSATIWRGYE